MITQIKEQMTELQEKVLAEAKKVADYVRANNFTYGHAPKNPAVDDSEKIVSCDRFVGWVLYNLGYSDQEKAPTGLFVWSRDPNYDLGVFCEHHGFVKITDISELQPADIVFVIPTYGADKSGPAHVFIHGGTAPDGNYYRYDCGSQNRIRCANEEGKGPDYTAYAEHGQPFAEPIEKFCFAYRPV